VVAARQVQNLSVEALLEKLAGAIRQARVRRRRIEAQGDDPVRDIPVL
jgi:hypothetical protein